MSKKLLKVLRLIVTLRMQSREMETRNGLTAIEHELMKVIQNGENGEGKQ